MQYPLEVLNRAADIFRMAGHMLKYSPPFCMKEAANWPMKYPKIRP
jgi:hypothetical protein